MATDKTRRRCMACKRHVMGERKGTNHILHLLLSVFSVGIWLPIWFMLAIKIGGWRCPFCGGRC